MTTNEIRDTVIRILSSVAPEAEPSMLKPDVSFRDQLDIDSMDFLNFATALHKEFRIEIPEKDYPRLVSLNGCIEYLSARQ